MTVPPRESALLIGMADDTVAPVLPRLAPRSFRPGDVLFAEGDPGDHLFLLTDGRVKLGHLAHDGRVGLTGVAGPGDFFGETSIIDPSPHAFRAVAMTMGRAVTLDRATLTWWTERRPEVTEQLLRILARRVRRTCRAVSEVLCDDAATRLAQRLIDLAQQFGRQRDGTVALEHGLTQEEIAQLIGTSRETVCKVLQDFGRRGWVRLDGKTIVIVDGDGLARRSRASSAGDAAAFRPMVCG